MIELKLNKRIVLVEVENGAYGFSVKVNENDYLEYQVFPLRKMFWKIIPSGNWSQPIKASEVTEEDLRDLLTIRFGNQSWGMEAGWRNYQEGDLYINLDTRLQSFQSLLKHHSLSPEKTILIIENI